MSNAIRYDSYLVGRLADELDGRLRRRRVEALGLDVSGRRAVVGFGDEALVLALHPTRGTVTIEPTPPLPEPVRLGRRTIIAAVEAPPDERILRFALATAARAPDRPRRLIVELLTNQMNLVVLGAEDRILHVLWPRTAGERVLRPGARYSPPPASDRIGASPEAIISLEEWRETLGEVEPGERAKALVRTIAYTSPINVGPILGGAASSADPRALDEAYERYRELLDSPSEPCVLDLGRRLQPYPRPLPGLASRPFRSLVEAIASAGGEQEGAADEGERAAAAVTEAQLERLRDRIKRTEARRRRLAEELADAGPEAERLRAHADLLLSQLYRVPKGADRVSLDDYAGGEIELELDSALTGVENANRLYEAARKRERAAERLPELVGAAEDEVRSLRALESRAEAGEAVAEEIERALGPAPTATKGRVGEAPLLPYRRYRTTGGLEVRVGRGRQANDELTFRHSSPNDVWLHARDVGGAHVILRWADAGSNPPARDLAEAATLAALHSKARTSGTVAVDWTRRKYVRKPRKAAPGQVTFERGKTIFVEPDEALEQRMRVGG